MMTSSTTPDALTVLFTSLRFVCDVMIMKGAFDHMIRVVNGTTGATAMLMVPSDHTAGLFRSGKRKLSDIERWCLAAYCRGLQDSRFSGVLFADRIGDPYSPKLRIALDQGELVSVGTSA
jgi:hypothetical protein